MRLEAKCPCGATFYGEDPRGSYINQGGKPDDKGRVYTLQVQFDLWHDAHKDHKASAIKEFFDR